MAPSTVTTLRIPGSLLGAGGLTLTAAALLSLMSGPLGDLRIPEFAAWHTLLETVATAMAFLIAVAAWYRVEGREGIAVLSAGFFSVAVLDGAHLLTFPGMPDWLGPHSVDRTLCFWFGARAAIALCVLLLLCRPRWQGALAWTFVPLTAGVLALGLAWPERLPAFYIDGTGLTRLKVLTEWALCFSYLALAAWMWRSRLPLRPDLMAAGLLVLGVGELFFTLYNVPEGLGNGLGHLYKLAGMAFILRAVVLAQIVAPYRTLQQNRLDRERDAKRLRDLVQGAPDGIVVVAPCGTIRGANTEAETLFGADPDGLVGRPIDDLLPTELREAHARQRGRFNEAPSKRHMSATRALRARRLDGEPFFADISLSPVEWDGEPSTVAFVRDATTRVEQMQRLDWLAAHDPLTGAPNRWAIVRELSRRCTAQERGSCLMIDVDNLGRVNDALGHETGDALLKGMAERIRSHVRPSDFFGRMEGDKFILICASGDCNSAHLPAFLDQLNRPLSLVNGPQLEVSVTAGLARFPEDAQDAESLIQASEIAMVEAKRTQRRGFGQFRPQLKQHGRRWVEIATRLPTALQQGEFRMVYQPRVFLADGRLSGAEALMRWNSPEGQIPPSEFIPIAEENGFILELGRWSLEATLMQMRQWFDHGLDPGQIGINLSTRQLADLDLPRRLRESLDRHRISPSRIKLEVTETAAMENLDWALPRLLALASEGVSLALDDFGTGYSSLAYLQRLPINVIKIDIRFVQGIGQPAGEALLDAIINLSHGLGKHLVAEGVETRAQADWLRAAGCEEGQGYLFSRPLEADAFAHLAHSSNTAHSAGSPAP